MARASIALWRSHVQGGRADRQLRRAGAQEAFVAWQVALGQRCVARQQAEGRARARTQLALCWTLWVHASRLQRLSRAHAARKLSARWMPRAGGQPLTVLPSGTWSLFGAGERVSGGWCQGLGGWGSQGEAILVMAKAQLCTPQLCDPSSASLPLKVKDR